MKFAVGLKYKTANMGEWGGQKIGKKHSDAFYGWSLYWMKLNVLAATLQVNFFFQFLQLTSRRLTKTLERAMARL